MTPAPAPTVGGARFNNPLDDVSRWEPHQPALLYELLDVKMYGADDLPARNLASALIGLESSRTPGGLERWLDALLDRVRGAGRAGVEACVRDVDGEWLIECETGAELLDRAVNGAARAWEHRFGAADAGPLGVACPSGTRASRPLRRSGPATPRA